MLKKTFRTNIFIDDYEDATMYMHRQRRITPPVYNERRLEELPIPRVSIQPRNSEAMELVSRSADSEEDEEHRHENCMEAEVNNFGACAILDEPAYDLRRFGNDALPVDENNDPLELKLEVINESIDGDGDIVERLVSCNFEIVDEDIAMYYDDIKAFTPKGNLFEIKRNDIFSGNIPFIEYAEDKSIPGGKVDRGFMIDCGGEMKEIRIKSEYIQKFVEWNTLSNDSLMDSRFVSTLMDICIGKTNLRCEKIKPNVVDFIKCKFFTRCMRLIVSIITFVLKRLIHIEFFF